MKALEPAPPLSSQFTREISSAPQHSEQQSAGVERVQIERYSSLKELSGASVDLLESVGRENFFLGLPWFRNMEQTGMEPGATPLILVARGKQGLAILPLRTPAGQNGSLYEGRWMPGICLASLTSYQTVRFDLILSDPAEALTGGEALARELASLRPRLAMVDLNSVDGESPGMERFLETLQRQGWVVRKSQTGLIHYQTEAVGNWQQYLASRSRNFRKELKKHETRFSKQGRASFQIFTSPGDDLNRALDAWHRVDAASWKEPEHFPEFTPALIREAAEAGVLRLSVLFLDDEPVAVELWLVSGGVATSLKGHYDRRFSRFSPGSVAMARMLEYLMERDGIREFDLGQGKAPYKNRWASRIRPVYGVTAFNVRTAPGAFMLARHLLGETLECAKRLIKRRLLGAFMLTRRR